MSSVSDARPQPRANSLFQRFSSVVVRGAGKRPAPGDPGLNQGTEIALTVLVFLGLGLLIDSIAGTRPIVTIALVVFSMVGSFVKIWAAYNLRMNALEAARRSDATLHQSTPGHDGGAGA